MACSTVYFLAAGAMCFFWFWYFELIQKAKFIKDRRRAWLSTTVLWILVALLIVNIPTGILFYLDEAGVYHRGPLYFLQFFLAYFYIFSTCARAFIMFLRKDRLINRSMYLSLSLFPIAPAAAGIIQLFFPQLPLACVALSMATLVMYLNWTDEMISVDPLTRLNNRKLLIYSYEQWQKSGQDEAPFYLLLIDANRFKSINDTYGHIEGDNALKRIAEALRIACHGLQKRANITRYGGDEFVILVESEEEGSILMLKDRIGWILEELNHKENAPYPLTVSIGITRAKKEQSLKELIADADQMMYLEKEKSRETL